MHGANERKGVTGCCETLAVTFSVVGAYRRQAWPVFPSSPAPLIRTTCLPTAGCLLLLF